MNNLSPNKDPSLPSRDEEAVDSLRSSMSFSSLLHNTENISENSNSLDSKKGAYQKDISDDYLRSSDYSSPDVNLSSFKFSIDESNTEVESTAGNMDSDITKVCTSIKFECLNAIFV